MKAARLVSVIIMVFCLSVVAAQLPQKDQAQPSKVDENRMEAAHGQLLSSQDKAKEASQLTQAVASVLPDSAAAYEPVPRRNFIDEHIFGKMERDKIPHAPLAGDEEFLRRAYLDATGLLPTPDQVRSFLADTDPNKRDKLIDSLIGTDEFVDQWAYHWGELLRIQRAPLFSLWTKLWLKRDRPYNEVFYDLVTAVAKDGGSVPTANAFDAISYVTKRCGTMTDPDNYKFINRLDWIDEVTTDIGRVFLGLNMECFSCHNGAGHTDSFNLFLTSMRRTDFWQQAAFFGNLRRLGGMTPLGDGRSPGSFFDDLQPGYNTGNDGQFYTPAEGRFPRDGRTYQPAFLLTGEKPKPGEDPRKALGRILPTHIQFSRALVNIVWQKLLVVGLVEPYDGFDLKRIDPKNPPPAPWTIQPANPELLEALAEDFRDHNFSVHHVIKTIMNSNTYRLSTSFPGEWKDAYIPYYARRFARVLTPPEAVDLIAQATGAPFSFREFREPLTYVKQLTNPFLVTPRAGAGAGDENVGIFSFMQAYFQGERVTPPVDKNVASPVQAMMMMSSPIVTKRVRAEGNTRVATLLKSGKSDDEIIQELFLSSLSRRPSTEEVEVAKRFVTEDRKSAFEDIQWILLNSAEFLVNH